VTARVLQRGLGAAGWLLVRSTGWGAGGAEASDGPLRGLRCQSYVAERWFCADVGSVGGLVDLSRREGCDFIHGAACGVPVLLVATAGNRTLLLARRYGASVARA